MGSIVVQKTWTGGKPPVNFPSWFPSAHPWLTMIIHSHLIESYRVYLSPWRWHWTYPTSPMSTENSQPLHDHEGTLCRKVVTWVKLEGWNTQDTYLHLVDFYGKCRYIYHTGPCMDPMGYDIIDDLLATTLTAVHQQKSSLQHSVFVGTHNQVEQCTGWFIGILTMSYIASHHVIYK